MRLLGRLLAFVTVIIIIICLLFPKENFKNVKYLCELILNYDLNNLLKIKRRNIYNNMKIQKQIRIFTRSMMLN